jgi:hypothetical protein
MDRPRGAGAVDRTAVDQRRSNASAARAAQIGALMCGFLERYGIGP